jgi:hypothetical protein
MRGRRRLQHQQHQQQLKYIQKFLVASPDNKVDYIYLLIINYSK